MRSFKETAAFLVEIVKIIKSNPDGITGGDTNQEFAKAHPELNKDELRKTLTTVGFEKSTCKNVGWLRLDERNTWRWFITEAGEKALQEYPEPTKFCQAAKALWKLKSGGSAPKTDEKDTEVAKQAAATQEAAFTFSEAQETAQESVANYLLTMNEYTFQDVVADLLEALGYHVDWVAPPGPDGGCDIVAFSDPLGVSKPVIKVQVKRKKDKSGAPEVKSFYGNLGQSDSGIFVCLGGFTGEAEAFARSCQQNLTLISLDRFVQLWIENYDKLTDKAKKRFRLEPIYFVRPDKE